MVQKMVSDVIWMK